MYKYTLTVERDDEVIGKVEVESMEGLEEQLRKIDHAVEQDIKERALEGESLTEDEKEVVGW